MINSNIAPVYLLNSGMYGMTCFLLMKAYLIAMHIAFRMFTNAGDTHRTLPIMSRISMLALPGMYSMLFSIPCFLLRSYYGVNIALVFALIMVIDKSRELHLEREFGLKYRIIKSLMILVYMLSIVLVNVLESYSCIHICLWLEIIFGGLYLIGGWYNGLWRVSAQRREENNLDNDDLDMYRRIMHVNPEPIGADGDINGEQDLGQPVNQDVEPVECKIFDNNRDNILKAKHALYEAAVYLRKYIDNKVARTTNELSTNKKLKNSKLVQDNIAYACNNAEKTFKIVQKTFSDALERAEKVLNESGDGASSIVILDLSQENSEIVRSSIGLLQRAENAVNAAQVMVNEEFLSLEQTLNDVSLGLDK